MEHNYATPLEPIKDSVFKALFANPQQTQILAGFLSATLGMPVEELAELKVVSPELVSEPGAKHPVVDVSVMTRSGERIQIEMQLKPSHFFRKRVTFGLCKLYAGQLASGDHYKGLVRCISIAITDGCLLAGKRYLNHFLLYDRDSGNVFCEDLEIYTLELCKVGADERGGLAEWLHFLSAKSYDELNSLDRDVPVLGKAVDMLWEMSESELERARLDAIEKQRREDYDYEYTARLEGRAEGLEKGMKQGRAEGERQKAAQVAASLKAKGLDLALIAEATGLPLATVSAL